MIKILFLAANPLDTEPLRLDNEMRAIDNAIRQAEFRNQFDISSHWAVRINDIQELFLRYRPNLVHFSGHGSETSEIILQNDTGQSAIVSTYALSNLFKIFKNDVRCVLLSACFSERQAITIGEHIDSVIGISEAITDDAAIQFSTAFYRGIGYGQDVLSAFNLGCNQLDLSIIDEAQKPRLLEKVNPAYVTFSVDRSQAEEGTMDKSPWWESLPDMSKTKNDDVIIVEIGHNAKNVAAGKNITQTIYEALGQPSPNDKELIEKQFGHVNKTLQNVKDQLDDTSFQMASFQLQLLESELTKTEESQVPSASTIVQIGNWLLDNVPEIAEAVTSLFATPAVGKMIGKAGVVAVEWVKRRFESE